MDVVKKSFDLTEDAAQAIDEYIQTNPGMSFTLIANQALSRWLENKSLDFDISANISNLPTVVKKSANIDSAFVTEINKIREGIPGLNMTLILNVALLHWLKDPKFTKPKPYTDSDIDQFMNENRELMDELAK